MIHPGVQFKAIEGDALATDRDLGEVRADICIEAGPVHTEIARGIAKAQQPRHDAGGPMSFPPEGQSRVSGQGRRP